MKLCCFFNYPPKYRESIFRKIDETFDCQFYFGREVEGNKTKGIKKIDFSIFKKRPKEYNNHQLFNRYLWRPKIISLAFSKYDTFLLTGDFSWSYLPFLYLCKFTGKKVYGWGHGEKKKSKNTWPFIKRMYDMLDGYFPYGNGGKQRLIELGFPEEKFHVIYNSLVDHVDGEQNIRLKSDIFKEHFGNDFPVVMFIGRLTPVKKLNELLEVCAAHKSKEIDYNLLFVGDGTEKQKLEQLAKSLGMEERVWFYGECYEGEELDRLLYNSDLCASPGNIGLTALHAMQFGVPVLTHENFELQGPEYETVKPMKTGIFFKCGSKDDLADKMEFWLTNYASEEKREAVRQNCYGVINDKFNSTYQIELLKEVLSKK